jgi:hypothetical protein
VGDMFPRIRKDFKEKSLDTPPFRAGSFILIGPVYARPLFGIKTCWFSRYRGAGFANTLFRSLIHAYYRILLIFWPLIYIQYVFHASYGDGESGVFPGKMKKYAIKDLTKTKRGSCIQGEVCANGGCKRVPKRHYFNRILILERKCKRCPRIRSHRPPSVLICVTRGPLYGDP